MVGLHERVFALGLLNYNSLQISSDSKLNVLQWRYSLKANPNNVVIDYLEFSWPVIYDYEQYGFIRELIRTS